MHAIALIVTAIIVIIGWDVIRSEPKDVIVKVVFWVISVFLLFLAALAIVFIEGITVTGIAILAFDVCFLAVVAGIDVYRVLKRRRGVAALIQGSFRSPQPKGGIRDTH
jgi:hypothetical protein